MSKEKTNEGIFGAAKKFSDAFFDGLKNNATKSMLSKAEKQGVPVPLIQKMKDLQQEKDKLDAIIRKYTK